VAGTCQLSLLRSQPEASGQRSLASSILLSLVLHGALFALTGGNTWVRGAGRLGGEDVIQPLLRVTLVRASSANQSEPRSTGQLPASVSDEERAPVPVASLPDQGEVIVAGKRLEPEMLPASMPFQESVTGGIENTPLSGDGAVPRGNQKMQPEGYLPREQLSAPPMPLQDIVIPWPPGLPALGKQSAIFTVFIDETGTVREMVPDGPTLAPIMVETARRVFMSTSFRPAQVGGLPVKAMLRIEVVFELEAMPSQVPTQNKPATIVEKKVLQ
jgi:hypothetical protein